MPKKNEPPREELRIPEDVFDINLEDGLKEYDTTEEVVRAVEKRGILFPRRPELEDPPELPPDLGVLDYQDLAKLHTNMERYYTYVLGEVAKADINFAKAEESKEFTWHKIRLTKSGGTQSDKDNRTRVDRRFVKVNAEFLYYKCYQKLVTAISKGIYSDLGVISRQITLRSEEQKIHFQNHGIENKKPKKRTMLPRGWKS